MSYNPNNIFAKIIRKDIECDTVYEDDQVLAFHDKFPKAQVHVLVIPKMNVISFDDFIDIATPLQISHFFKIIKKIAKQFNLDESGYRLIANHGQDANQEVEHFHVHILGKNILK